jgi:hypothetical protein
MGVIKMYMLSRDMHAKSCNVNIVIKVILMPSYMLSRHNH